MAGSDSYAQALMARRGRGMDASLLIDNDRDTNLQKGAGYTAGGPKDDNDIGMSDSEHTGIDKRVGVDGAASASGERKGAPSVMDPSPAVDRESTTHLDQHTSPVNEGRAPSPPADRTSPTHLDEHTSPVGEAGRGTPMPASQSTGMGGGDLESEIRDYVSGHASQNEYDQLKGMRPRSLGERAKMDALKSKYSPAGNGKNG